MGNQVYGLPADNLATMLRRLPITLSLALVVVACTGGSAETTLAGEPTTTSEATSSTADGGVEPTTTTSQPATTTTAPDLSGLEGVSPEVQAQLENLITVTQEVRRLPFLRTPQITVVSEDELEARIRADVAAEAEDFPADEALYKMLGLLNPQADFEALLIDVYGEQVAGYYDGETEEIVVPAREGGFTILQQGTLVHELVHALTDQHFAFQEKLDAMVESERLDQASAYQALLEGDASFAQVLWVQSLTQREIGEFIAESLQVDSEAFDAAPRFLRESLLFPYDAGLSFAQALYAEGGWVPVNDAYATMPELPGSTEQVITPNDYREDLPLEVEIGQFAVPGYQLERTSTWGEQGFRVMLNQGSGVATMAGAADGWGGDSYHQWYDGAGNAALLIVYQGDSQRDLDELEEALLNFANEAFPEGHFAWVEELGGRLYFVGAHDTAVGEGIRASAGLD